MADHDTIDHTGITGVGGTLGAWTAYTPTWTGGSPSIGDGTLTGRYKALDSKTYAIQISLVWGSTSNPGGSGWFFSLPAGLTSRTGVKQILAGHILDSGTDHKVACGTIASAATTIAIIPEGGVTVGPGSPMTWATGDELNLTGIIEVA